MINFSKNIISDTTSIKEAIEILNIISGRDNHILFVLNDKRQLIGTLSDGDVRRGMLASKTISQSVTEVMQKKFKYLKHKQFSSRRTNSPGKEWHYSSVGRKNSPGAIFPSDGRIDST